MPVTCNEGGRSIRRTIGNHTSHKPVEPVRDSKRQQETARRVGGETGPAASFRPDSQRILHLRLHLTKHGEAATRLQSPDNVSLDTPTLATTANR